MRIQTQIAIVGGGIAGLWLLNLLKQRGHAAVLFEKETLGGGQTLASQGMIHGGIKYALDGFTTSASETIGGMPARWQNCLSGNDTIDLSDVKLLSTDYFLFSDQSVTSRITAFFGSKSVRGRVTSLARNQFPPAFANTLFKGSLYRLQDMVIDSRSLVASLAAKWPRLIFKGAAQVNADSNGEIASLNVDGATICADHYIFAAGSGNEALTRNTALGSIAMQTRPLRQVLAKKAGLPLVYAHAVSLGAGSKPRLTIPSHIDPDGDVVWYLGGNLAETGVARDDTAQIAFAKAELNALMPWIDLAGAAFRCYAIDRAEPDQSDHGRPDSPFSATRANATVCWPTKLTLTPLLGDEVCTTLASLAPIATELDLPDLPRASVGSPPWDWLFRVGT